MKVLLIAEESAGLQVLRALARSSHTVVAVMASPPKPGANGATVWSVAREMGLDTWPARLVREPALADRLRSEQVEIILNVHSLHIIHEEVLAAARWGAYNVHPSPLPRYAGLNAISWAIYRGEKTHGVTVHKMEPRIDTGPIVFQAVFPIEDHDTALSVSFKCMQHGLRLMHKLLEVAATDPREIHLVPQDLSKREYFGAEIPDGGKLLWSSTAERIVNLVRACDYFPFQSPWQYPRTRLNCKELAVVKASRTGFTTTCPSGTIGSRTDSGVMVAAADEWILAKKLRVGTEYWDALGILKTGDRFDDPT